MNWAINRTALGWCSSWKEGTDHRQRNGHGCLGDGWWDGRGAWHFCGRRCAAAGGAVAETIGVRDGVGVRDAVAGMVGLALLFSLGLTMLEAFVIRAFCQYCLISLAIVVTMAVLVGLELRRR